MLTTRSSFRLLPEDGTVCCTKPPLQDMGAQHCLHLPTRAAQNPATPSHPELGTFIRHLCSGWNHWGGQDPLGHAVVSFILWDQALHLNILHPLPTPQMSKSCDRARGTCFSLPYPLASLLTDDQMRHMSSILAPGIPAGALCLKQREVASGIQRQSLKGQYITCTIAATKLSHLYQKEATSSKHQ